MRRAGKAAATLTNRMTSRFLSRRLLRLRTDEQLVACLRAGNDDALAVIHERYRDRLLAYVRRMTGSEAEDVVQDVFARAYAALRADGRPVVLRPWLYRVAHNRCMDVLRRPAPMPTDLLDSGATSSSAVDVAEGRERLRTVVADIAALPETQRSALIIRELEGLSYEELATTLSTTVPAVKSLLVRARMNLARAAQARDAEAALNAPASARAALRAGTARG